MPDLIEQLRDVLGSSAVLSSEDVTQRAISYWNSAPMTAKALLRPASTQDVSNALAICYAHKQKIVVQGGNTTCVQGTLTGPEDIILSLERLNKIIEIDTASATAAVEAGVVLETLQNAVKEKDLFLPLDLGARGSCTIGGNLATNAGGVNVLRYGMARAMVLGLEAVLPDGTILSSMDKMIKNNAGYDLKQIFVGTEGTLGVITRAVVRLMPRPVTQNTALVALPDFSAVAHLLNYLKKSLGPNLSAFEVMWGDYLKAVTEPGWHTSPIDREHPFYVLFESDGSDPERDDGRFIEILEGAFNDGLIIDAVIPKSENERQSVWAIRDDFEAILNPKPMHLYDVSLSISHMEAYVVAVKQKMTELLPQSIAYVLGHVGDGNLHFFVQTRSDATNERQLSDQAIYEPLREYNGSISAEHGIGVEKKPWLTQCRSAAEINAMKRMKNSFDPAHILNANLITNWN
ncbi:MAG: FAD-binding oxidoreductase [Alphaproteobacteria bacterium]